MVRKKIRLIGMIMILLSCAVWIGLNGRLTVAVAADNAPVKEQEFEGYLITEHSANEHDDPSMISKECIQMPECASSGYGISVKQADGKYRFFKFDGNGQERAKEILAKTTKTNGIILIAKGIPEGETLKVAFLQEKGFTNTSNG